MSLDWWVIDRTGSDPGQTKVESRAVVNIRLAVPKRKTR